MSSSMGVPSTIRLFFGDRLVSNKLSVGLGSVMVGFVNGYKIVNLGKLSTKLVSTRRIGRQEFSNF
jgi:hypothetical protein